MRDVVFFDINETTLDLQPLTRRFEEVFGSPWAGVEWFGRVLHASTVCAMTGVQTTFRALAEAGLDRSSALFGVALDDGAKADLLAGFASLSPYADVRPALDQLRRSGYQTVAFSNSSSSLLQQQLESAGLADAFDAVVSVQEAGTFKPDRAAYRHALSTVGCEPSRAWMLAAHDWDVHGAMSAGMRGAYVARSNVPYHPALTAPTVVGPDLVAVVEAIVAR